MPELYLLCRHLHITDKSTACYILFHSKITYLDLAGTRVAGDVSRFPNAHSCKAFQFQLKKCKIKRKLIEISAELLVSVFLSTQIGCHNVILLDVSNHSR